MNVLTLCKNGERKEVIQFGKTGTADLFEIENINFLKIRGLRALHDVKLKIYADLAKLETQNYPIERLEEIEKE